MVQGDKKEGHAMKTVCFFWKEKKGVTVININLLV